MKYQGLIKKSRTADFAVLVGALGIIETNFQLLEGLLGEWYGLSYIVVAVVVYILRAVTTGPMGQKDAG